jgi:hypothetical protein
MRNLFKNVMAAVAATAAVAGTAAAQPVPTTVVPEPSTYVLLGTGAIALGLIARARRNKK